MQELFTLRAHLSLSRFFSVRSMLLIFLVFCVVILRVFTFWVSCCDVRYGLRIEMRFGSSFLPVVCRRAHVLFTLFVFVCCSSVQKILCCVFLSIVYPMLPVSLDCPFLSSVYSLTFIYILVKWWPSTTSCVLWYYYQYEREKKNNGWHQWSRNCSLFRVGVSQSSFLWSVL
jgi:hypothetical protein